MIVSLVLPCYNPPEGWEQLIYEQYSAFQQAISDKVMLILVLDGTGEHINQPALDYLRRQIPGLDIVSYTENRGKGYAIRQGVKAATGAIILYTDVDFPYTRASMLSVYNALKNDECDVAAGIKNDTYYAQVPLARRIISKNLRFMIGALLSMPVTDTQCGLKGFRQVAAPLFLQTTIDRYLFDLEFLRNCFNSKKFRVKAIPVALNENVQFRNMNYRILMPEMINFIKLVLKKG